ncbi:MAG: SIMPL domain-containing protein [Actinomycetota bacterium]
MKRIGYISAGVVLGAIVALTLPSLAQDTGSSDPGNTDRTVTVSGTATITAKPDEAVVSLGVQTQANTAQGALSENATKMTALIAKLMEMGVSKDDIATSYVSIYPTYGNNGMDITGYQAVNQVDVTLRDISKVGEVIDEAVKAGANLSNGITFQLSDENQGVNQALDDAVANARSKAETLAGAGDAQLGQVVSIQEGSGGYTPPIYYGREMMAGAMDSASTPIQPPTLETQVSVTVTWSLT